MQHGAFPCFSHGLYTTIGLYMYLHVSSWHYVDGICTTAYHLRLISCVETACLCSLGWVLSFAVFLQNFLATLVTTSTRLCGQEVLFTVESFFTGQFLKLRCPRMSCQQLNCRFLVLTGNKEASTSFQSTLCWQNLQNRMFLTPTLPASHPAAIICLYYTVPPISDLPGMF